MLYDTTTVVTYAAFGIFPLLILVIGVSIYNTIITNMNAVARAWADVITQERQKDKVIPTLETMLNQYAAHEKSVLIQVTELRTALHSLNSDSIELDKLTVAREKSTALIGGLQFVAENYPTLKASDVFLKIMSEISEQEEMISAAIRIFNQNVEDFNNGIEVFPNSLINSKFNKKSKMKTFGDSVASSHFEYTPNIS